ncbi:HEAT repeat domain-containing protein [Stieleria sp. TO1_6]|uniref:PVC-type heme-binding CxxCH protein n=1 Tax=Stieleria tagensis TaxID=2956795 RepID=UPI00209B8A93|nr:PVC-type heme-binding CxxCH protein [Stieleria tagensis]MCO8125370.1 HEAT repeat domain-containing protein [Stieleria tagensis]
MYPFGYRLFASPCLVFFVVASALLGNFSTRSCDAADPFRLADGDRVVMIGDGLIEQEQYFGWIELMLTTTAGDRDVTFRNLGWNADTPAGESRFGLSLLQAGHEPKDEGWRQLEKQIQLTQPTVALLGYGMASALEASAQPEQQAREESLTQFVADYQRLVRSIKQTHPNCRFLFLSPISTTGNAVVSNQTIARFADAIQSIAQANGGHYVDLTQTATAADQRKDPIHLNSDGYRSAAQAIRQSLGLATDAPHAGANLEPLRDVILEKNRLWFHRSRPANMAYVFGFRKHEQGQNAVEIPQYDKLIAKQEARIQTLRQLSATDDAATPPPTPAVRTESKFAEFTPQPTPEFVVADDLEVTLWAENPMLNKPIHMNFDPQGRLWLASSEAYPMIEVGQAMPDKVLILEDSNQDGTADKSTLFADGLLIPTGLAPGDGGVYVAQSTDLLFLKDTDGDGTADHRERVLSGFGTEDTHHNLHTLLFGPDGRLYMNQSVYTRTDTETPYGVVRLKAGGGFRFDTENKRMDTFFQGLWNPWGHQFDAYGNSFMSDGAGFAGIAYVFPGARFNPTPKTREQLDLISPGSYPKFCGAEIVYGDSFPDDWQGSLITCDFRANRVTRFTLSQTDAGYVTTQQPDLIRTGASSFRPIDVKQGPDGALYIADWSNPIINHGEVDFRDPRRDRWHGRIWRVAPKGLPRRPTVDLTTQSIDTLMNHLVSKDRYLSDQSRRVLIQRKTETAAALASLWTLSDQPVDRLNAVRLSAAVGKPNQDWLETLLNDPQGDARAAATRILADWADPTDPRKCIDRDQALSLLTERIADPFPRTRLEATRGLARLGDLQATKRSLRVLDHPMDRFLHHALFLNVDEAADRLIADLDQPEWKDPANLPQLEFVLTSVAPAKATEFLQNYLANNPIAADGSGPWIGLIAKAGGPQQLGQLYRQAIEGGFDQAATIEALKALLQANRLRRLTPKFDGKPAAEIEALLADSAPATQSAAIDLAGAWKLRSLVPELTRLASQEQASTTTRTKAIAALRACGGQAATDALIKIAQADAPLAIQTAAVSALAGIAPQLAVKPFYQTITRVSSEQDALPLWRALLSSKDGESLLVSSLPADGIPELAARAGVRAAGEGGRKAQSLIDALMPMSGMTMTAADWTPERAQELARLVPLKGDPARGELVYRRSSLQCATCHSIGGVGGKVGPDMTSLGASAPVDYIIESMFDPNAKIKENYHSVTVLTENGQIYAGIESGSTDEEIVLRDASNKLIRIPEADVAQVKQGKSLMPESLLDRVSQQDQLDLISFLTQLGKPGDYDASRQNVARVLDVFAGNHRIEQAGNADIVSGQRTEGWKPLQARVSGKISRETLQRLSEQPRNIALVNLYLRTQIEVGSPTEAKFTIDHLDQAKIWIDGQSAGSIGDPVKLSPGKHTLLVQFDARDLPETITLRSDDVTFVTPEFSLLR